MHDGITLKSRREIELMRDAGRLVAEAHQLVQSMIEPGVRTADIDAAVEEFFAQHDAVPLFKGVPGRVPFPAVTCISINEEVVHGIPGRRQLKEGDIVSVDTGCRLGKWCGDAAWTYPVGEINETKQKLLEIGELTLRTAIRELTLRRTWFEVAARMEDLVKPTGFTLVEDFVGHGIGQEMHEDPQVPNFVGSQSSRQDFRLEPGLVLAIEPMVNAGSRHVRVLSDYWTVVTQDGKPSVHFEHTVALTDNGPEILTAGISENDPASVT